MRWGHLSQVLISPRVSEKAMKLADSLRCHTFKVAPEANKSQIRAAVELMFDVKVTDVNVINMRGKKKGQGRHKGRRNHWKKAYVTLAEGEDIQIGGTE